MIKRTRLRRSAEGTVRFGCVFIVFCDFVTCEADAPAPIPAALS